MTGREQIDDPLDDLRRAWHQVAPAPSGRPLADEDAVTRAGVGALQQAWRSLAAPPYGVPAEALGRARRRRSNQHLARLGLAASVLLALPCAALVLTSRSGPASSDLPAGDAPPSVVRAAAAHVAIAHDDGTPRVLRTTADRIEMRAGVVRLILLAPRPRDEGDEPTENR